MRDLDAIEGTLRDIAGPIAAACRHIARTYPPESYEFAVEVSAAGQLERTRLLPINPDAEPVVFPPDVVVLTFDADPQARAGGIAEQVRQWAAHEREKPRCRQCGCTDDEGCPQGCWWVAPDLCSSCADEGADQEDAAG